MKVLGQKIIILCELSTHRNNDVVFLNFEFDKTLNEIVRRLGCARWSQTNLKCYLPCQEFKLARLRKAMDGLADIDVS